MTIPSSGTSTSPGTSAGPGTSPHGERAPISYCPYCAEETLFPTEGGWECRTCLRAFSVTFRGLVSRGAP